MGLNRYRKKLAHSQSRISGLCLQSISIGNQQDEVETGDPVPLGTRICKMFDSDSRNLDETNAALAVPAAPLQVR